MNTILIYNHDIQKYPPILSAIKILISLGQKVVVVGYCSDANTIKNFESKGVIYHETIINDTKENKINKFLKLFSYRKKVKKIIELEYKTNSSLWIYGNQNIWLLYKLVFKYKTILYLFEIPELKVSLRYKILSPFLKYTKTMQEAWKVVCCEYNRAQITKSYFNLKELPVIIPNKPDFDISQLRDVLEENLEFLFQNKKVILYQGIFNYPERRLDELCESIEFLSEEFVICIMGGNDANKQKLIAKYESDRVFFLPFISAPKHLEITKKAYIGYLSYFSTEGSIEDVINTLYCAPNKIYEYSCFGIPMISNNIPGLSFPFEKFNAGRVVCNFTPKEIATTILEIDKNYEELKSGSLKLFNSVDITVLIKQLIN